MQYFRILPICLLISLLSTGLFAQTKGLTSENRLFHIERSKNKNLVCYDINLAEDGTWHSKQPLDVYWVNQEERSGQVNGLSGMERKFAYGYKVLSRDEKSCRLTLTAYPGRELTIRKEGDQYQCTVIINGQPALLQKLYVQARPGHSLSVEYVELTGICIATGKQLSEKVSK